MKRSWLVSIKEWVSNWSNKPWACFETTGPDHEGHVHFSISANRAFIENLQRVGLAGRDDAETLQLFFLQVRMAAPADPDEFEVVNPEEMPNLSSDTSIFKRG